MIVLESVTVEYQGVKPLDGVTLEIQPGTTAVMGPSGSGKSTLLRVLAGLQVPTSGTVSIDSEPVAYATWRSASDSRVSVIHQDYRLVSFLTVEENLLLAAELRDRRPSHEELVESLTRVALSGRFLRRRPSTLSGGEQQRVAIARALLNGSSVLLADEPTGALDAENSAVVAGLLADLGNQDGLSVIVVTHDPDVASRMACRLRIGAGAVRRVAA